MCFLYLPAWGPHWWWVKYQYNFNIGTLNLRLDMIPKLPRVNASFMSYSLYFLVWSNLFWTLCSVSSSSPPWRPVLIWVREEKSWRQFGLRLPTHPYSLSPPEEVLGERVAATTYDPSREIVLGEWIRDNIGDLGPALYSWAAVPMKGLLPSSTATPDQSSPYPQIS